MDIKTGKSSLFIGDSEDKAIAYITFEEDGDYYSVDHTVVDSSLQGQGIAAKLVEAMIGKAKEDGKKIKPVCSYVVRYFEKHPEKSDIL